MKIFTLTLLILFVAVMQSYANEYGLYQEDGRSIYSIGPSNGTSFGGEAPQGEWQYDQEQTRQSGTYSDWQEPMYQLPNPTQPQYPSPSYGVPSTGKPIAPCGPYYAPRAAENCY